MDRWAVALEDQLSKQNDLFQRCTNALRSKLGGDQVKKIKCGKCDTPTWIGALVKFPCEKKINDEIYEVEHPLCFDCLEDKLERHRGFLDRERSKPDQRALYDRCLECVVTCDECHTPAVISRKYGYEGGIGDDEGGDSKRRRVRYIVDEELTNALRDKFHMHVFFENQRRSPFSKFSRDRLFRFERPAISNQLGEADVGEQRSLGAGYAWLEDWRVVANVAADEVTKKVPGSSGRTASLAPGGGGGGGVVGSGVGGVGGGPVLSTNSMGTSGMSEYNFASASAAAAAVPAAVQEQIAQTVTDPSGWQYAFLWPSEDSTYIRWMNKPTANTFVRRRKKIRAYLNMTPELKKDLQHFMAQEQAAKREERR